MTPNKIIKITQLSLIFVLTASSPILLYGMDTQIQLSSKPSDSSIVTSNAKPPKKTNPAFTNSTTDIRWNYNNSVNAILRSLEESNNPLAIECATKFLYDDEQALEPNIKTQDGDCKKIGKFYFTAHAIMRMKERGINSNDACDVISHGNRYNNVDGKKICFSSKKNIAVIIDDKTNTVITLYNNYTQELLDRRLKKRDLEIAAIRKKNKK